jgi:hypothetical protein
MELEKESEKRVCDQSIEGVEALETSSSYSPLCDWKDGSRGISGMGVILAAGIEGGGSGIFGSGSGGFK